MLSIFAPIVTAAKAIRRRRRAAQPTEEFEAVSAPIGFNGRTGPTRVRVTRAEFVLRLTEQGVAPTFHVSGPPLRQPHRDR